MFRRRVARLLVGDLNTTRGLELAPEYETEKLIHDYADENFLIFGPDTPTNNPYRPSATPDIFNTTPDILNIVITKNLSSAV